MSKAINIHKKKAIHKGFKTACTSCNPMLGSFGISEDLTELIKLTK